MTQERPCVQIEKKQYFDQNIWDMSIDITYFVLDILQVVISRSTYYILFERMCLTDKCSKTPTLFSFCGQKKYCCFQGWNSQNACQNSKQGRPLSDLIWVWAVCLGLFGR